MPSIGYFNRAHEYNRLHVSNSMLEFLLEHTEGNVKQMFLDLWFGDIDAQTFSNGLNLHRTADVVEANYLSVRKGDEPLISYVPYNKIADLGDDVWKRAGRQTARPGRMLRTLFTKEFLDSHNIGDGELEDFANKLKSYCKIDLEFKIVSGEDVRAWYHEETYDQTGRGGTLNGSCMRYDICQPYLDLYALCGVRMLIAVNSKNKVVGRALVWDNVECRKMLPSGRLGEPTTISLMDRVYYNDDSLQDLFFSYAVTQGWHRKRSQNYSDKIGVVAPDGTKFEAQMTVPTGLDKRLKKYPYVDTFTFMERNKWGTLFNTAQEGNVEMTSTDGQLVNDYSDMVETDLDGWVRANRVATCPRCGHTGSRDSIQNARFFNGAGRVPIQERVCTSCLSEYVQTYDGSLYISREDAVDVIVGMSYRRTPTIGHFAPGTDGIVQSRFHDAAVYRYNCVEVRTPTGPDFVIRGAADVTYSVTYDAYILTSQATWDSANDTYRLRDEAQTTPDSPALTVESVRGGRSARS